MKPVTINDIKKGNIYNACLFYVDDSFYFKLREISLNRYSRYIHAQFEWCSANMYGHNFCDKDSFYELSDEEKAGLL